MSTALYTVRVFFEGSRGIVKVPGLVGINHIERHITSPPQIPGLPRLTAIDYAPEVHCTDLTPYQDGRREMKIEEIQAVTAWLMAIQRGQAHA